MALSIAEIYEWLLIFISILIFYSRIGEIMNEIVNDYGVVWVASAGNHGEYSDTVYSCNLWF